MDSLPSTIRIDDQLFQLVVRRKWVSIYRGPNCFLRIGPEARLQREAAAHRRMLEQGFPVAEILAIGRWNDHHYYIEASLGSKTFGDQFDQETRRYGSVQPCTFSAFLDMVATFTASQLRATAGTAARESFLHLINVEGLTAARPDLAASTWRALDRTLQRFERFPTVLTHGDFHAFNVCPSGVIDLESVTEGIAGYDQITALLLPKLFPPSSDDYGFSALQARTYLARLDTLFESNDLPPLSDFVNDFKLCTMIWLGSRRERPRELVAYLDDQLAAMLRQYVACGHSSRAC